METEVKEVSSLSARFAKLEEAVAAISQQLSHDSAGRRLVVEDVHSQAQDATPGEFKVGSSKDLQADFKSIRDKVAKIKLPTDQNQAAWL